MKSIYAFGSDTLWNHINNNGIMDKSQYISREVKDGEAETSERWQLPSLKYKLIMIIIILCFASHCTAPHHTHTERDTQYELTRLSI